VGKDITNSAGDNIGEIQDVAIGPDRNAYAVVSVGEFLGLGGKDVPVQISELTMQGDDVVLMSQSTKEELKARPEYDPSIYQSYSESKDH
jgi:sporulation protein YlmC with PRC-barrel domain